MTAEGQEELRALFETIEPEDDGRVPLSAWGDTLKEYPDILYSYLGLDADASTRFRAFFLTGRVNTWIAKTFRRLGLNDDDYVNWEEFDERATGGR